MLRACITDHTYDLTAVLVKAAYQASSDTAIAASVCEHWAVRCRVSSTARLLAARGAHPPSGSGRGAHVAHGGSRHRRRRCVLLRCSTFLWTSPHPLATPKILQCPALVASCSSHGHGSRHLLQACAPQPGSSPSLSAGVKLDLSRGSFRQISGALGNPPSSRSARMLLRPLSRSSAQCIWLSRRGNISSCEDLFCWCSLKAEMTVNL